MMLLLLPLFESWNKNWSSACANFEAEDFSSETRQTWKTRDQAEADDESETFILIIVLIKIDK